MNKKKAIKIATATALAASSFAAVAPFTTEAAVNVSASVTKATKQMKKAQDTYTSAAAKGQVASAAAVQKEVTLAKSYYDAAKKDIAKAGGKNKAALTKQLDAALPSYNNAKNYIAGVNFATGLKASADKLAAAVSKKDANYVNKNFASFSKDVAGAEKKVKGLVVGATAQKVVIAKYVTPASKVVASANAYLGTVKTVSAVADVEVNQGEEKVELPKQVQVTLVNGKKVQKTVTWDQTGLDLTKPETYALTGKVSGTTLTASVKVVVKEVPAAIASVKVVDVNKLEVKFNHAVDTDKAVVKLTKGLANYNVSAKWNDAKDTVVLTAVLNKLSATDYTVKVEGLTTDTLSANVTVADEKADSVEVATTQVDTVASGNSVTVYFKVVNQYGTDFTGVDFNDLTVLTAQSIKDVTFGTAVAAGNADANGNLRATFNVTGTVKAGDSFKVTAIYKGLTTSSTVGFVAPVALSQLSFGQVQPLKDTKRITVNNPGLVVPITAVDQYGKAYKLKFTDFDKFVSSNNKVVDAANGTASFAINTDGNLTFTAGAEEGTAIVTAILKDGSIAQFSVTVNGTSTAKTVQLSAPTALVADGEKVSLDMVVTDQFGEVIANKDAGLTFETSDKNFTVNPKTGKVEGTVKEDKAFKVTVKKDGKDLTSVTFAVEAKAFANTVTTVNFPTLFEVGASKTITADDVVVKDQYGRDFKPETGVTLTAKDNKDGNFSGTGTVKAEKPGTATYTVQVDGKPSAVKDITLTAVASKDITSYELKSLGTIYYLGAGVAPELVGKTADGKTVVLKDDKIKKLTTSNSNVAQITEDFRVVGGASVKDADGSATIKAWDDQGNLLGSTTVTVTNKAPQLKTVAASEKPASKVEDIFDAKDQYNADFDEKGTWYFTTAAGFAKSTTNEKDILKDLVGAGEYSVKFVSADGETIATTVITITLP